MHMFCFQCQETSQRKGCTSGGTCGKDEATANRQDLLVFVLRGIGVASRAARHAGVAPDKAVGQYVYRALYATITNTNFDLDRIDALVVEGLALKRRQLQAAGARVGLAALPEAATWDTEDPKERRNKGYQVGVLETEDEDIRSLRETITYALKGIAAYAHHADLLGSFDPQLADFVLDALAGLTDPLSVDQLFELALATGRATVTAMALLDQANVDRYGVPRASRFSIGVGDRPGILVSGHDLKDMEELLEQTRDAGVDVYTHGEMISAQYYPAFRKHPHLAGNYGNSWWRQDEEFARFNGPILMTSNCIIPVTPAYKDRIFTAGVAGYPGVRHLAGRRPDGSRDFGEVIALAKRSPPPEPIDTGEMVGGFGHEQLVAYQDKLLELVRAGRVRRVIVIGGCDGRDLSREYYKDLARALPQDTLILTGGCTKFMFWKLPLGEIDGIPRVLDAGQCADCYSLVAFALKLKETLGLADPNGLPLSINVAWYDQKAVAVLLALLALGFRGMRLGPSLPAFLSPNVLRRLVDVYQLRAAGTVEEDLAAMMRGE